MNGRPYRERLKEYYSDLKREAQAEKKSAALKHAGLLLKHLANLSFPMKEEVFVRSVLEHNKEYYQKAA